ncbi:MAG: hypothetical protein DRJ37_04195 [Thermoprotei archaeon]|nr:MAG: hypothetical protein DRJ37_04195 [Thermoprotei archaeon]
MKFYGVIGNGETLAFISPRGSIDWWCIPRFHGLPVFARILNPELGGKLEISASPTLTYQYLPKTRSVQQRYFEKTNILHTVWRTQCFNISSIDFFPWKRRILTRVVKIKKPVRGPKKAYVLVNFSPRAFLKKCEVSIGYEESEGILYFYSEEAGHSLYIASTLKPSYVSISDPHKDKIVEIKKMDFVVRGVYGLDAFIAFKVSLNSELPLFLGYGDYLEEARNEVLKARERYSPARLEEECRFWKKWLNKGVTISLPDKDLENAFYRSLLTLKLLTDARSGGIIAAGTTSLAAIPERDSNWDYRYVWVRDGVFTAEAFDITGHHEESRKFYEFMLKCQRFDGYWRPLYTVNGEPPLFEIINPGITDSYGHPIRLGNAAASHFQIDSPGLLLNGFYLHYILTRDETFLKNNLEKLVKSAIWIIKNWHLKENGIWEERFKKSHWLFGKVACYAGLKAIQKLLDSNFTVEMEELNKIKEMIVKKGWSSSRESFVQKFEPNSILDISVLSLVFYGVLDFKNRRIVKTTERIKEKLRFHNSFLRFEGDIPPFYLSTLWMARLYAKLNDGEKVLEILKWCLDNATDLKLMAERYDPILGGQRGNFPQAFSHEELVKAVMNMLIDWRDGEIKITPALPLSFLNSRKSLVLKNAPTPYGKISFVYSLVNNVIKVDIECELVEDIKIVIYVPKPLKVSNVKPLREDMEYKDNIVIFPARKGDTSFHFLIEVV